MHLQPTDALEGRPTLSVCISTVNRAKFIRTTLEAILPQLTDRCEVLVVDNASTDNTPQVLSDLTRTNKRLRYVRQETNNGMDSNFDRAVELARGEYCWLTSDDDLMKPGAVAAVLNALRDAPSAVIVNYEFRDLAMTRIVQARVLDFEADRTYGPWELERMFVELGDSVRYIGALIMKRDVWRSRQRNLYMGSWYAFVGMLYQERLPRHVHVIAEPCVSYRVGNAVEFDKEVAEIIFAKWPSLIESLPIAYSSKRKIRSSEPWKHFYELLVWRGIGLYNYAEYRRWMRPRLPLIREKLIPVICALAPRSIVRPMMLLYLSTHASKLRQLDGLYLEAMKKRVRDVRKGPEPELDGEQLAPRLPTQGT